MAVRLQLTTWYLNGRRLVEACRLQPRFGPADDHAASLRRQAVLHDALMGWIEKQQPPSLEEMVLTGTLSEGRPVVVWRAFYSTGVPAAIKAMERDKPTKACQLRTTLDLVDEYHVRIPFSLENATGTTAREMLSGRRRLHVVGIVGTIEGKTVEIIPLAISQPFFGETRDTATGDMEISPGSLDAFSEIQDMDLPTEEQYEGLRKVPERTVKAAFAKALSHHHVPKDWGGETSDLYAAHVMYAGRELRAAFAFKGPAKFHPLHLADTGKRADQIVRLANEPAELLIVQHCHEITASVRQVLRALAITAQPPKHYCFIDGSDTYRILAANGAI